METITLKNECNKINRIIEYRIKNVYGQELCYPLTFKNELEILTRQKTLSLGMLESLEKMGFELKRVF